MKTNEVLENIKARRSVRAYTGQQVLEEDLHGFYLQTKAFVEGDYGRFCMVEEHVKHVNAIYKKIVEE